MKEKHMNLRNFPHKNLPSDAVGWKAIVEPAKDAYWLARRNGRDETSALLAALDVAIAAAEASGHSDDR